MSHSTRNHLADSNDRQSLSKRGSDSTGNPRKGDRSKRLRVSRACDQCRAGREKCDGAQPTCQTCETQSRSCSYNEQPKKRGIQPHYIRTLELTLEWVLQQYPESERALSQSLPDLANHVHRLIAFKDISAADTLHQDWRNGIVCRQIDQLLSGAEIELPVTLTTEMQDSAGPRLDKLPVGHSAQLSDTSDEQPVSHPTEHAHRELRSVPGSEKGRGVEVDEVFQLPQNAWNLLEHYFAFTQTFLPITEKHDLLKLMYSYPMNGLPKGATTAPAHAELWAIMAWSSFQLQSIDGDFRKCQRIAQSLIPSNDQLELSHAKALLVLVLIEMSQSSWMAAWLMIGSAVRVLTHLIAGIPFELVSTSGRTRHTLLAAFLLENTVAAQTGAITHLPPSMVQTIGLPIEDGIEEWSPWSDPTTGQDAAAAKSPARSISTFNELIRIALRYRASEAPDKSHFDLVLRLLQNASADNGRENPSKVLLQASTLETGDRMQSQRRQIRSSATPIHTHGRTSSFADSFNIARDGSHSLQVDHQHAFMAIPNEMTDSLSGSTPAQLGASGATPNLWAGNDLLPHTDNSLAFDDITASTGTAADIFEELALLDQTEESASFMQNLGFGPDLDLAEFFGNDYQPSNPLLMSDQYSPTPATSKLNRAKNKLAD